MKTKTKAVKVRSLRGLFRKPDAWCKGYLAKTIEGFVVEPTNPLATSFCLLGGLERVYDGKPEVYKKARERLTKYIKGHFGRHHSVASYNDAVRRKFTDIQKVIRAARV